ncbi:LOW QUALITY PROTEIN: Rhodanese domain-containing protein, partial [Cephalotus follicularis]
MGYLMLRCRSPLLLSLRMLSSSYTLNPNSTVSLLSHFHIKSKTRLSLSSPPTNISQTMTVSKCSSSSATSDPIPIPGQPLLDNLGLDSNGSAHPQSLVVVSFYKFAEFPDHADLRQPLKQLCEELRISGGIILASEGINGSICGTRESVERVLGFIQTDNRLQGLRQLESPVSPEEEAIHHGHSSNSPLAAGEDAPFRWDHVRVKLKKEIVTLGMPTVFPTQRVGKYVSPRDWNALISEPDTVVIDVRNNYETRIGKFKGAIDPCTTAFREFPSWVEDQFQLGKTDGKHSPVAMNLNENTGKELDSPEQKMPKRVAMYCTGGIRCEKASSFLLNKGFKEVYHLEGGILKYLEEVPKTESLWEGECFVFDKRVSVEHGLTEGSFNLCYGCKQPVSDVDMVAPEWESGVSCPHCYSSKSEEEKERARARQRQFKSCGIIGGPDKGRRPKSTPDS